MRTFKIILAFCLFFTNFGLSQIIGNYESDGINIYEWNYSSEEYELSLEEAVSSEIFFEENRVGLSINGKPTDYVKWSYDDYNQEWNADIYLGTSQSGKELKFLVMYETSDLYIYSENNNGRYESLWQIKNLLTYDDIDYNSTSSNDNWLGTGSGIILTIDGYIATNYHVIEDISTVEVEFIHEGKIKQYNADIVKIDPVNDLAILKINDKSFNNLKSIEYNFKTKTSDIGESVFALGYPETQELGTDLKFTDGKISSLTGYKGDVTRYQTTTPIMQGNSGGPLFDKYGNLIAINTEIITPDRMENVSYSVKSIYLLALIETLPEDIKIPSSRLLEGKDFPQQFKTLKRYVTLVRVK